MLLGRRCVLCDEFGWGLCPGCVGDVQRMLVDEVPKVPHIPRVVALWRYDGAARDIVRTLKYDGRRDAVAALAAALAGEVTAAELRPTECTWAPGLPHHVRQRGFDQAKALARGVSRELHIPLRQRARRLPGPSQVLLSRTARRAGPKLAPAFVGARPGAVLIVDDVTTTGGTLAATARTVIATGARVVGAAVVTYRPPPLDG